MAIRRAGKFSGRATAHIRALCDASSIEKFLALCLFNDNDCPMGESATGGRGIGTKARLTSTTLEVEIKP
jgi:hypothetical protein